MGQLKLWMEEMERRRNIRNEIRQERVGDETRDIDVRPKARLEYRDLRSRSLKGGVTYHYDHFDDVNEKDQEKKRKEDRHRKKKPKQVRRILEDEASDKDEEPLQLKSQVIYVQNKGDLKNKPPEPQKYEESKTQLPEVEMKMSPDIKLKDQKYTFKMTSSQKDNSSEKDSTRPTEEDENDFSDVFREKQLTKLIQKMLRLKQSRPKIVIGPIRGSKLRLNGKKLKIAPYDPQKKKIKTVLKIARHKEVSEDSETHNDKKKK